MSDVQEPWASAMVSRGYTHGRYPDRASWRALARKVGVHPSTLTAMANGERGTDQATVDAVAEAIGVSPVTVSAWVGRSRTERKPYEPPASASLLDQDERDAVDRIITLMTRERMRGGSDATAKPPKKSPSGGGPHLVPGWADPIAARDDDGVKPPPDSV